MVHCSCTLQVPFVNRSMMESILGLSGCKVNLSKANRIINAPQKLRPFLSPSISNIRMMRREEDQTSKLVCELCSVLFAVLRSPQRALPPSSPASSAHGEGVGPARPLAPRPIWPQASPAAVASLMLGVSMSLMVGGSVSFVLGFMLLPWVLGMLTLVYLAGIVSSLSGLGRAILFPSALKEEVRGRLLSILPTD